MTCFGHEATLSLQQARYQPILTVDLVIKVRRRYVAFASSRLRDCCLLLEIGGDYGMSGVTSRVVLGWLNESRFLHKAISLFFSLTNVIPIQFMSFNLGNANFLLPAPIMLLSRSLTALN